MLGTKCPSTTSRWIQSAPAASTARTSSPNLEKSDARIDGAMTRGRGANCWDIFQASRDHPWQGCGRPRVTCAGPAGNAERTTVLWAENSAVVASIAGAKAAVEMPEIPILLGFLRWHAAC